MENDLIVLETPELKALEASKAEMVRQTFEPMVKMLSQFETAYVRITERSKIEVTKDLCVDAKRLRIDISKVRIATEKERKAQKEEYLRAGKAIDGVANILKWAVADKEAALENIEKHFENTEKERLEKLQSKRLVEIAPYYDAAGIDLASMQDDVYQAYLAAKKKDYADRLEAERKAEEERKVREAAEAAERERMQIENERLKKEAEEYEAKIRAEREAAEKRIAEERAKAEAVAKIESEKRAKIEAELKAKEEAERKTAQEAEAARQQELAKGDTEKLVDLKRDLESIVEKYAFDAENNKALYAQVQAAIRTILNKM